MSVNIGALPHLSKGIWHAGFQTTRPVISLKTKRVVGNHTGIQPTVAPRSRQACRQVGRSRQVPKTRAKVSYG